jgi:hypothetical protein
MMVRQSTLTWTDRKRRKLLEVDQLRQEQLCWESQRDAIRAEIVSAMATKSGVDRRFSVAALKERYGHVYNEWRRVSGWLGAARREFDTLR